MARLSRESSSQLLADPAPCDMAGMSVFVHPDGRCESRNVGAGTRVWAFAHVLPGARIGSDCNICDHVFIENDVVLGDRVTLKCGVQLWDGARIGNDVFIGPNATFTNDAFPRSKQRPPVFLATTVADGASIGANATILPGLKIGRGAMVGAGSVVTHDVPPFAIVRGNPARITGYVSTATERVATEIAAPAGSKQVIEGAVPGVKLLRLPLVKDLRGSLSVSEFAKDLPFTPQRYFVVFDVPSKDVRGQHAHKVCHQLLVCLAGSVRVMADDGERRMEAALDSPDLAFYLPAGIWGVQYRYSPDAVLLVLASHPYDPDDYIREYEDFLAYKKKAPASG